MPEPQRITSRDNPWLVKLRKLVHDPGAYRRLGCVWIEGEHLCASAVSHGLRPAQALVAESAFTDPAVRTLADAALRVAVIPDVIFKGISVLGSPARIGFLLDHARGAELRPGTASVVLDRVQDPGNVGSILRTASALGLRQVVALVGTAGLWSPKVVRSGMGAHFALQLVEGLHADALASLALPLVATSAHDGVSLRDAVLPRPCAWVFGHEGEGVSPTLLARCHVTVRIPQPGGQESLNVAAAAAICLYEYSLTPPVQGMG